MDVLVEVTPGAGWLAREADRIVWLPDPEPLDVAHDVIEPLLIADTIVDAQAVLADWTESDRPLPSLVLLGLAPLIAVSYGVDTADVRAGADDEFVTAPMSGAAQSLDDASCIVFNDADGEASGMFVEGVIRAGGFRVHVRRRGVSVSESQMTAVADLADAQPGPAALALDVSGDVVPVGQGLVLGRWPYSHRSYDETLEPVILADPSVSRLHAEIRVESSAVVLIDRDSHNGTWRIGADGESDKLEPGVPVELSAGDRVRTGDTEFDIVERPPDRDLSL